jgi:hypothetical protein
MSGLHGNEEAHGIALLEPPSHTSGEYSSAQGSSLHDQEIESALDQVFGGHSHEAATPFQTSYKQQNGTEGQADALLGDDGNDFLSAGQQRIEFSGSGTGPDEFPFPNDSPGEMSATAVLEDGRFKIEGSFSNFDGAPLFSVDGADEKAASDATVFSGDAPQDLVDKFRNDAEGKGFEPTGVHLHFSPEQEADATIIRTLQVASTDAKSGTISGDFALSPEEQAAASAAREDGNGIFYLNNHTNINADADNRGGFLNGEVRFNLNSTNLK